MLPSIEALDHIINKYNKRVVQNKQINVREVVVCAGYAWESGEKRFNDHPISSFKPTVYVKCDQ